jgi:hypothetical protein
MRLTCFCTFLRDYLDFSTHWTYAASFNHATVYSIALHFPPLKKGDVQVLGPYAGNPYGDPRLLAFDPANWIWAPQLTNIFANGDGFFLYPASGAPGSPPHVSTLRFEAQRDGVEDWQLFRLAVDRKGAKALVMNQVTGPQQWSSNVTAFEEIRRTVASLAIQSPAH